MAIAFDNATTATQGSSVTSITFSHTVSSGSNRILFVAVGEPVSDVVNGVTYAGVALTFIGKALAPSPRSRYAYLYYLVNPASGANNVIVSCSGTADALGATAMSYTGARQGGQPDASVTNTNSSASAITTSLNVVLPNSWAVLSCTEGNGGVASAGTGLTFRGTMSDANSIAGDSNGALSSGSHSMTVNYGGTGSGGVVMASFSPPQPLTVSLTSGSFALTGGTNVLGKLFKIVLTAGSFVMTGLSMVFRYLPNKWTDQTKHTSTWTDSSKSSSSTWTKSSKDSTTWTDQTKN